jgi:hypothetical protein
VTASHFTDSDQPLPPAPGEWDAAVDALQTARFGLTAAQQTFDTALARVRDALRAQGVIPEELT